ncbi:prolyl oligopeptidase family serine peptidase [Anderseniella sp. Alg231-50]|uniref:prolyl oligopeptidase family serine peptidase n=1 Tax=Anderseniella sp. Alg231-50 TaxID=1922226 RepID=UPI000D561D9C
MTTTPPRAVKKPVSRDVHGHTLTDNYGWLRADNWQEVMRDPSVLDADIRAYLESENAWVENTMAPTESLQETLFDEMKGRIKEDDSSVPSRDGNYSYGVKYITGGQQPLFVRTSQDGNHETVLVDGNKEADGKEYFRIGGASHSPDHKLVAFAYDDKGSEFFTLVLREAGSSENLTDVIPDTGSGGVWSADSKYVFYIRLDENHRPSKLFCHKVGSPVTDDVLVHEETDAGFFMNVSKSQSGEWIIIDCHDHQSSESWLIPAAAPLTPPRIVEPREPNHEYSVDEAHGILYILTNSDAAEDFRIVTAPVGEPARKNWQDLVAHTPGTLILDHTVFANHLARLERHEGLPRIIVRELASGEEHTVSFDEEAYSLGMSSGYEFDTSMIRFSYSSMTTPSQVFDYDMASRQRTLRKQQDVPSGHDPTNYVTRRIMATADDGALVPISLLYHKDTKLDGSAPVWLYGYGSYGIAIPASFNTNILSLANRGFVYAIAHVRGGKDKGYGWYKAGKMMNKKNTFSDFITAARHLSAEGFTSDGNIVAQGGSAGGMLMGTIANMAPELFRGIIAEVPFVDVLNTMLDDTLPLTPPEWPEWGNPGASSEAFDYMRSYSPYDNVAAQAYPNLLAVGGLTDPRVTYWEPAKWVAKLRELKTNDNLLLFKTQMGAGHGGSPGRFDRLKEVALVYAFGLMVADRMEIPAS